MIIFMFVLLLIASTVSAQSYVQPGLLKRDYPLVRGLIGAWIASGPLASGTKWYDLRGNSHGTLVSMTASTAGWFPNRCNDTPGEMRFDTGVGYVDIAAPAMDNLTTRSFVIRAHFTAFNAANNDYILNKRQAIGWLLSFDNASADNRLQYRQDTTGTQGMWYVPSAVVLNKCYTIGITADCTGTPNMWIDGVQQSVTVSSAATGTCSDDSGNTLRFGNLGSGSRGWGGGFSQVYIWNRQLSGTEMVNIHRMLNRPYGYREMFQQPQTVSLLQRFIRRIISQ